MQRRTVARQISCLLLLALLAGSLTGCSRRFWRLQAERDTYRAAAQKLNDPHWKVPRIDLTPDPRSRFFDPYDPDCEPLPPDDPAAHEFMHCMDGKRGYKSWHKFGTALSIENPHWLEPFGVIVPSGQPRVGHDQVVIEEASLQDTLELSYIHSREYQTQIENLYLAALNLTFERFQFGVRYLDSAGREPGANLTTFSDFGPGPSSTTLGSSFGVSQLLPSGAQLAVELANSTVWLFGAGGTDTASELSFSLVQPLLFQAGRKVVLEALTQAERDVLYEARNLARFRQVLFTQIANRYLNLLQQEQTIRNNENNIKQIEEQIDNQAAVDNRVPSTVSETLAALPDGFTIPEDLATNLSYDGAFLKWTGQLTEEQAQRLQNLTDDPSFNAAIQQMIRSKQSQVVSLNLSQLIDRRNQQQNSLAAQYVSLNDQLDALKITLGLPPNINLTLDQALLSQFTLIDDGLLNAQESLRNLAKEYGSNLIPPQVDVITSEAQAPEYGLLRDYVLRLQDLLQQLQREGLQQVATDFEPVQQLLEATEQDWSSTSRSQRSFATEEERTSLIDNLGEDFRLFQLNRRYFEVAAEQIDMLASVLAPATEQEFLDTFDANGNGTISTPELPAGWSRLPQFGTEAPPEERTIAQLSAEARNAALALREELLKVSTGLQVIQVNLRVEIIALNEFILPGATEPPDPETAMQQAVQLGLENRHDLMNARAAVMDARRFVEIAANALEADLNVVFEASTRNPLVSNRPLDFRGDRSSLRAGLQFTAPIDQINERNAYSQALIAYQRARRTYMALEDEVKNDIRGAYRAMEVARVQLRTDRLTVRNAARQYDAAALAAQGAASGQGSGALNLLNALQSVLQAQNALIRDWIGYETNRLNIFRDMGIMDIDPRGVWTDPFYQETVPPADAVPEGIELLPADDDLIPPAAPPDDLPILAPEPPEDPTDA